MVGLVDPPRDEIPDVIRTLRGAGIKIHMVTGDFKLTAQAIASQCGIITQPANAIDVVKSLLIPDPIDKYYDGNAGNDAAKSIMNAVSSRSIVISGPDILGLEEKQWDRLCKYDEIVFARTTPEQKLRIVKELQARGETVGMTGIY